jgi:predicted transcriptional regulator
MRKLVETSVIGFGLALLSPAAFAVQVEDVQALVVKSVVYGLFVVAIVVGLCVYCTRFPDKRTTPLRTILNGNDVIYSVGPNALVMECAQKMRDKRIGGLIVMNGEKLIGIFTERDALSRVLAAGRDPRSTTVSEVMTRDPHCVCPETSVGEAMELVTEKRFRHLPIMEDGELLGVLSSRDLTQWLAKDRMRDVQDLVRLAAVRA